MVKKTQDCTARILHRTKMGQHSSPKTPAFRVCYTAVNQLQIECKLCQEEHPDHSLWTRLKMGTADRKTV